MKKNIIIWAIIGSFITISWVSADCFYQKLEPTCSIWGQTYTSSCAGWSDTSTWSIPVAYDGECQTTKILSLKTKNAISDILYNNLLKKDYVKTETEENYTLTNDWEKYIQKYLFPAIQKLIAQEIKETSPNHTKIAIFNSLVDLVGYDYYMKK